MESNSSLLKELYGVNSLEKMKEYLEKRTKVWDEKKESLLNLLQDKTKSDSDVIIACRALISASTIFQLNQDTPLEHLDMSRLLKKPLESIGIKTFGDLFTFYDSINPEDPWLNPRVKEMKGFGRKCWRELREFIAKNS